MYYSTNSAFYTPSYCLLCQLFGFGQYLAFGLMFKLMDLTAQVFIIAVKISAPILMALFLVTAAMGVLARTVPQMNVFLIGFPLQIGVGLAALVIVLPLFSVFVERLLVHTNRNLVALLDFLH